MLNKTVLLLVVLAIVSTVFAEKRKIQILPSVKNQKDFPTTIIEVTQDYVDNHLVGSEDFTFVDVTDEKNLKVISVAEPDYPPISREAIVKPILQKASTESTSNFMTKLTSFSSRRSSQQVSQESVLMIKSEIEKIIKKLDKPRQEKFKIELIPIRGYVANSIIVTMKGKGSDADNHVLFGAHSDDVGHPNAGADDDGSGTTAVFESFKIIAKSKYEPSKTLCWLFYSAEESGLVGSWQIARDWKARNVKVYGHLNYDMVGNHKAGTPLQGRRLTLNTTPKITRHIYVLSRAYTKLDIDEWRFNGGSDHIPWFRSGYPSACVSERHFSPHYHRATDKKENVDFELITEFARLGAAYMIELS